MLSRFSVSQSNPNAADSSSERIFLTIPQPEPNHNGGQMVFGPDDYLYIGLGDGGGGGDPQRHGQNTSTLYGSILRIDVSAIDGTGTYSIPPDNPFVGQGGARGEIWAYGLRNPWRITFDRLTGDLWAADVGQDQWEEVDLIKRGRNYGWNVMEGAHCFSPSNCSQLGLELPVAEYGHGEGCSIAGGYVYRGSRFPSLYGAYVYSDSCSGRIWALRYDGMRVTEDMVIAESGLAIVAFAEDPSGELYMLPYDIDEIGIYKFAAR